VEFQIPSRYLMFGITAVLTLTLGVHQEDLVYATTQNQFETHTITGQSLNNDPFVAKILSEIEYSKKQVALLQKNQHDAAVNDKLVTEQRIITKNLQEQALQAMQIEANKTSPNTVFNKFISTVRNNSTKLVFLDEFDFTTKKIDAGHAAMKKILNNGGTYEEAVQEFSKYAAIKRVQMIEVNKNLNIKHGLADAKTQADFNSNGILPYDYVKVPLIVINHART
jgi:hypothetical protein